MAKLKSLTSVSDSSASASTTNEFHLSHRRDTSRNYVRCLSKVPENVANEIFEVVNLRRKVLEGLSCKPHLTDAHQEFKSPIEKQLESSADTLTDLRTFGLELISNLKVANEKRELLRRKAEEERKKSLEQKIVDESKETLAKFDEIIERWFELKEIKEPMALYEALEEQKARIAELMESKNDLMKKCQDELKRMNIQYQEEQKRCEIDVCCFVERVDNQIELMNRAYSNHLDLLINTIEDERKHVDSQAMSRWNILYENLMKADNYYHMQLKTKNEHYERELERIAIQQEELTRATRVRLDKDAEMLEIELRVARNNALLNSEKLDYNYNVLQKRTYENTIVFNQQKRRIAKLTENISQVRKKIANTKFQKDAAIAKTVADIEKLHETITQLENQYHNIITHYKAQFFKIWNMNYNEVKDLLQSVLDCDRVIHQNQLNVNWEPIEISANPFEKYFIKKESNHKTTKITKPTSSTVSIKKDPAEIRVVRHILRKLADRTGFLVESKILEALEPYYEKERCLIRLHAVFGALKIHNIHDIMMLVEYFKPFMFCSNCNVKISDEIIEASFKNLNSLPLFKNSSITEESKRKMPCEKHELVMEPAFVLTALNNFTNQKEANIKSANTSHKLLQPKEYLTLSDDEIEEFWSRIGSCIPENRLKLWKAVEHSLKHYMEVLQKRTKLHKECEFLKRQNFELNHLLKKI